MLGEVAGDGVCAVADPFLKTDELLKEAEEVRRLHGLRLPGFLRLYLKDGKRMDFPFKSADAQTECFLKQRVVLYVMGARMFGEFGGLFSVGSGWGSTNFEYDRPVKDPKAKRFFVVWTVDENGGTASRLYDAWGNELPDGKDATVRSPWLDSALTAVPKATDKKTAEIEEMWKKVKEELFR